MSDEMMKSHITQLFPPEILKKLFIHALLVDIDDNNEKIAYVKRLAGSEFIELGPGTNRYAMLGPDGFCYKFAMDRRGIVDNLTEFKRSPDIEWCSPKVYETNGVILVAETVELITKDDFIANKQQILHYCAELAKSYIFTDIGFATKNFCNWGIRKDGTLVILDTGYLIPIYGNEDALYCPACNHQLKYNANYTGFVCGKCGQNMSFTDIYRRINNRADDELFKDVSGVELPDFDRINDILYNSGIVRGGSMMKGGHLVHELPTARPNEDGILRAEDIEEILRATGQI